jgi:DNA-directed RNA polymerase subunit beta
MTWEGYNYEDAVLLSERLVQEDVYTSVHIEEYEAEARDTKLDQKKLREMFLVLVMMLLKILMKEVLSELEQKFVQEIFLVGKVTPKGETELTAEERLLRAIFGEKAREVKRYFIESTSWRIWYCC